MKRHSIPLFLCAGLLLAGSAARAAAPDSAFKAKFGLCMSCHGANGKAILPTYPNLAGQHKAYLVQTLKDLRDGKRASVIMGPMAKSLSDEDIDQVATYFSMQKPVR
jgi:Cytochrome c553